MKNSEILIVLFNLKAGVSEQEYELFAKNIDFPTIKSLSSTISFSILKGLSLFGSNEKSPYQYIEIMEVSDFKDLEENLKLEVVQIMLNKFMQFAENPKLITTQKLIN